MEESELARAYKEEARATKPAAEEGAAAATKPAAEEGAAAATPERPPYYCKQNRCCFNNDYKSEKCWY